MMYLRALNEYRNGVLTGKLGAIRRHVTLCEQTSDGRDCSLCEIGRKLDLHKQQAVSKAPDNTALLKVAVG